MITMALREKMGRVLELEEVVTYEVREYHKYITTLVDIKELYNGYGYIKVVTFQGLSLYEGNVEIIDNLTEFECEYTRTSSTFDGIPFGSVISLYAKPKLTILSNGHEELRLSRPKRVKIEDEGDLGEFKPYIKLPRLDTNSFTPAILQLREKGIEFNSLNEKQQRLVREIDGWRRNIISLKTPVEYIGNLRAGLGFKEKVVDFSVVGGRGSSTHMRRPRWRVRVKRGEL